MNETPAGWYDDGSGQQRWWDGSAWTEIVPPDMQPADAEVVQEALVPKVDAAKRRSRSAKVTVLVVAVVLLGAAGGVAVWRLSDGGSQTSMANCSEANLTVMARTAKLGYTSSMVTDRAGNLYVADRIHVEKITPSGTISIVAGNGKHAMPIPGPATSSPMMPTGLAIDTSGNLYIADFDAYTFQSYLEKVTPDGTLSVVAGGADRRGGPPTTLGSLNPTSVAVDGSGNLYVADNGDYLVKIRPSGSMSIIAGTGHAGPPLPGPGTSSPIWPLGLAADANGNVYAADIVNSNNEGYVVKINSVGTLSIVAGDGKPGALQQGPAISTPLYPVGIALDSPGNIFISSYEVDARTFRTIQSYVVKITPAGTLSKVAGNGQTAGKLRAGHALSTTMNPGAVATDRDKSIYVANSGDSVAKLTCSR